MATRSTPAAPGSSDVVPPAPAALALPAFGSAKRIVVKVGSSLVTNRGQGLDREALARWASQIARLRAGGREIVLVSSGAIAEGMQRLGWSKRPSALNELQAAAAVGQMGLAQVYESCFREHGLLTSQVLLTHEDLADRRRYLNARSTLVTLLGLGVIPIINENDTVTTEEIKLGDNDTLASLVTNLIEAEVLVILTDQPGIFTGDPRLDPSATLLATARAGDPHLESIAGGVGSAIARGGMLTKVLAAKRAARSGACTIVASGEEADVLVRLAAGESIGTLLVPDTAPMAARKQWLADQLQVRGQVTLDAGAVRALLVEGKSLLPIGAVSVSGDFDRGELVRCVGPDGAEVARGLANYPSSEASRIAGLQSRDIEARLGYVGEPELIHRDNMVVTARP